MMHGPDSDGRSYKEPYAFFVIIFGVIAIFVSIALALLFLDTWSPPTPQKEMKSLTTSSGLHLTFLIVRESGHTPDMAFDGSSAPDSFWEARGPFPIELTIERPNPVVLAGYAFTAGEEAARMPSEWAVEGSPNNDTWTLLDKQSLKVVWVPNQSRKFNVVGNKPFRFIRFQFLAGFDREILRIYEIELH
jgi:hypothetical protein